MRKLHYGLLAMLMVTTGCSSTPDKAEPARLERISEEVSLVREGRVSLGGDDATGLKPAVTDSGIVAASADGEVVLLSQPDLDEVWSTDVDSAISAGVGASETTVFVVTSDARLIALSLDDGSLLFEKILPSAVTTPPQVDNDRVFVKTQSGRLMALSVLSGETVWIEEAQGSAVGIRGDAPMTLTENILWVLWETGRLVGYQADNGRVVFERQVAVSGGRSPLDRILDTKGAPSVSNDRLATATRNGQLSVLDLKNGQIAWSVEIDAYPGAVIGFNAVTAVETDGTISTYSLATGESLWSTDALKHRELSPPAVFGNTIAVVDFEGILHLLSPVDGRIIGRLDTGSAKGMVAPVVADSGLLVQLIDGRLTWVSIDP